MVDDTVAAALAHRPAAPVWPADAADDPGWDVALVLDNREVRTKKDRDYFHRALEAAGVRTIVRALPLGDMMWVATSAGAQAEEVEWVCPYIVERKTAADLRSSIADARYKEQKLRLAECGVPHVVYLVEGRLSLSDHDRKLRTAMVSTQLHDCGSFRTKQTADMADSVRWLTLLTRHIQECVGAFVREQVPADAGGARSPAAVEKALSELCAGGGRFEQFKERASKSKNETVGDLWAKQLVRIPRISAGSALVIHERWPTAAALYAAYEACEGREERLAMVEQLKTVAPKSGAQRKLGRKPAESLLDTFS